MWWNCAMKHLELGGLLLLVATPAQCIRPQPELPLSSQCCSAKMRASFQTKLCFFLDQGEPHQWKTLWARWNKFLVLATLRLSYEEVIPVSCFYTFPCSGVQGALFSPSHPVTALIPLSRTPGDMSSFRNPWTPWPPLWLFAFMFKWIKVITVQIPLSSFVVCK